MARNALRGFALLAALGGCRRPETRRKRRRSKRSWPRCECMTTASGRRGAAEPPRPRRRLRRQQPAGRDHAGATARGPTVTVAEAALADSIQKAREIEVMRETFAYAGAPAIRSSR